MFGSELTCSNLDSSISSAGSKNNLAGKQTKKRRDSTEEETSNISSVMQVKYHDLRRASLGQFSHDSRLQFAC